MLAKTVRNKTPNVRRLRYGIKGFGTVDAYTPEESLSLKYCSYGYNIRVGEGVLRRSCGIGPARYDYGGNEVTLPLMDRIGEGVQKMHHFVVRDYEGGISRDELIVYGSGHHYFRTSLTETTDFTEILGVYNTSDEGDFINYYTDGKDYCLIFTGSGGMYMYDGSGEVRAYPDVQGMSSVCMHYDRVFGVSTDRPDTIYFSAPLKPYEFSPERGGGSISLMDEGGKILKIISFRNAIYIFREYSVHKLTAYTDPTEYSLCRIYQGKNRIKAETIASDHLNIVFLAGRDAYIADSISIKRFYHKVTPLIADTSYSVGYIFDNKYYLATVMKTDDVVVGDEGVMGIRRNNAMFVFNLYIDETDIVRGVDVAGFTGVVLGDKRLLFVRFGNARSVHIGLVDDSGKLFSIRLKRRWQSATSGLDTVADSKILRRVYLATRYDVDFTAIADGEKSVKVRYFGGRRVRGAPFNLKGDYFTFVIESDSEDFYVVDSEALFDINRRYNAN